MKNMKILFFALALLMLSTDTATSLACRFVYKDGPCQIDECRAYCNQFFRVEPSPKNPDMCIPRGCKCVICGGIQEGMGM
uniref:Uncharacterized protein n=2 Tax=Aegilops tauschii subsp. strangulata TaxID=200361 RepID=A0A453G318_AEGTS